MKKKIDTHKEKLKKWIIYEGVTLQQGQTTAMIGEVQQETLMHVEKIEITIDDVKICQDNRTGLETKIACGLVNVKKT